jgi:hypothetical protein
MTRTKVQSWGGYEFAVRDHPPTDSDPKRYVAFDFPRDGRTAERNDGVSAIEVRHGERAIDLLPQGAWEFDGHVSGASRYKRVR